MSHDELVADVRKTIESARPIINKWMDMSAYGMAMKHVFSDTDQWFGLEGGDADPALATKLGFVREEDGWALRESTLTPRTLRETAPRAFWRPFVREDAVDTSRMTVQPVYQSPAVPRAPEPRAPAPDAVASNQRQIEDFPARFQGWPYLHAYDMAMRLVCDDESMWYALDGGDNNPELAAELGFTKRDGEWLMVGQHNVFQGRFAKLAPLSTWQDIYREDAIDTSRMTRQPVFNNPSERPAQWNPPVRYGP